VSKLLVLFNYKIAPRQLEGEQDLCNPIELLEGHWPHELVTVEELKKTDESALAADVLDKVSALLCHSPDEFGRLLGQNSD
jgi:hypothetical protein